MRDDASIFSSLAPKIAPPFRSLSLLSNQSNDFLTPKLLPSVIWRVHWTLIFWVGIAMQVTSSTSSTCQAVLTAFTNRPHFPAEIFTTQQPLNAHHASTQGTLRFKYGSRTLYTNLSLPSAGSQSIADDNLLAGPLVKTSTQRRVNQLSTHHLSSLIGLTIDALHLHLKAPQAIDKKSCWTANNGPILLLLGGQE